MLTISKNIIAILYYGFKSFAMTKPKPTRIGPMSIALLTAFLLVAPGAGAAEPGDTDAVFDAKANELVAGKSSRLEKITAIHIFVRDSIRQVETQYG